MHEVANVDLEETNQPTEIFYQTNNIYPMELANYETTPANIHQDNGASPPQSTQTYSPHSPLAYTSVAPVDPLPHPCDQARYAAHLACAENLPEVFLKGD